MAATNKLRSKFRKRQSTNEDEKKEEISHETQDEKCNDKCTRISEWIFGVCIELSTELCSPSVLVVALVAVIWKFSAFVARYDDWMSTILDIIAILLLVLISLFIPHCAGFVFASVLLIISLLVYVCFGLSFGVSMMVVIAVFGLWLLRLHIRGQI